MHGAALDGWESCIVCAPFNVKLLHRYLRWFFKCVIGLELANCARLTSQQGTLIHLSVLPRAKTESMLPHLAFYIDFREYVLQLSSLPTPLVLEGP